jgi:hypothetical protein
MRRFAQAASTLRAWYTHFTTTCHALLRKCSKPYRLLNARLRLEGLEAREMPATLVTGTGAGSEPLVRVFDTTTNSLVREFLAYDATFTGGVRVATGDVSGDGVDDVITVPGPGGGPLVKIFDGTDGKRLGGFLAYDAALTSGLFVATGQVDGTGRANIIVAPDAGGGPHVKVFRGIDGAEVWGYMAYAPTFTGGVRLATAELPNGHCAIVTGAGPGGGPHVTVTDALTGTTLKSFFAYDTKFTGGVFVAAGDVTADGMPDVVTGPDVGGGPHVKVFDGAAGKVVFNFMAGSAKEQNGVRVAVAEVNGDAHLVS